MDEFLYKIELSKLNTLNTASALIKQMGILTSQYIKIPGTNTLKQVLHRNRQQQNITLTGLVINDLDFQITTIYTYALYLETRDKYFELGFNINKLPQYALWTVPYIDINKTIQHLRIKHDTTKNCK